MSNQPNLPTAHPAEAIEISPENLEIANTYLQCQDLRRTADELAIPPEMVAQALEKREVKAYVDSVFFNVGFNNRFKMRKLMDKLIERKLQEMDEADIGSNKDITELLTLSHKMTMELMDREIALLKLKKDSIKVQTNVQINDAGGGTRYGSLIQQLIENDNT